jgi:hypothetical protein
MKLRILDVEGNPKELADFYKELGMSAEGMPGPVHSRSVEAASGATTHDPGRALELPEPHESSSERAMSIAVARRALSRRPLSPQVKAVFKAVYDAHPNLVASDELQKVAGYTGSQLAGLFGAFGRRLAHTEGFQTGDCFWKYVYDHTTNAWSYGLYDESREAIRLEGLV